MVRYVVMISMLLSAIPVFGIPFGVEMSSYRESDFGAIPVYRSGIALPQGTLIQVIRDGGNQMIDAPSATGLPGGDDIHCAIFTIGHGTDTVGTFSILVTAFTDSADRLLPQYLISGDRFYLRIWCNETVSIPVTPESNFVGCYWSNTSFFTCPPFEASWFDIQVLPNSQNPVWTLLQGSAAPESEAIVPTLFSLTASPNPFNATTTIRFNLPQASLVQLQIVNALGQTVAPIIHQQWYSVGMHLIQWDAGHFPAGIYIARCQSTFGTQQTKLVLLK
ncbi:MAG: T9SS type A sorting domain-containing protein [bacterium]|nr:T9SS type A sorting domain-containing protein [bacterium]